MYNGMQADALNCMFLVTDARVYHVFRTNKSSRVSSAVCQLFLVRNMACKGKLVRSDTKAIVYNVYLKKNKKIHQD